ncbi:MAG: carboxypeptidase regulatory-like domain-containing protein, partial [Chloroflexi bacterium]|nr:carboxypeptidase regulatory-like domain-containing protein [Chloroflexota bacterium]
MKKFWWVVVVALIAVIPLLLSCQGPPGPAGPPGTPGTSSGTVTGTITNNLNQKPVAGVNVTTDPAIKDVTITSGADGGYSAQLPIGTYKLTFQRDGFTSATETVTLVAGQTVSKNINMKPASAVAANAGKDLTGSPDGTVTLKVTAEPFDNSTVTGYQWSQIAGVTATIDKPDSATITVTLGNAKAYKIALLAALKQRDSFTVQAINPHALGAAETATFKVTVTTSSGKYSDTVNVVASLPYAVNGGLANVPVGVPVLLHAKNQGNYNWVITSPTDSKAVMDNARDQNPSFTPDVVGKYSLTEKVSGVALDVYAGTWAGAITGLDAKGRPVATNCTVCHNGKTAPDKFTAWSQSGHAEIFTQNINDPAGHWGIGCATCHTVGYDPEVKNNGFDEAMAAENWQVPPHGEVGYYAKMLKQFPKTASFANIQCENCHGPNNSPLHPNKTIDAARVTLSADGCATCHGEPPRHGRFQQWEDSRHAGTSTTPARATSSASCARCHAAQGFLAWIKQPDMTLQLQGAKGNATVAELAALGITADQAEPITCVVCHDPHAQGTTSSKPTNATVRIVDSTSMLPAGFQAKEVGKGALCMTCHNTRNAVHNIDAPPTSYSAPHTAAQADVIMGENAYFVSVPQRSPHSLIENTCVTCHMEATPPPPDYNQSGTNHTFRASTAICATCHSSTLNAEALMVGTEAKIHKLADAMSTYLLSKIQTKVTVRDYTAHDLAGKSYDVQSDPVEITKDNIAEL